MSLCALAFISCQKEEMTGNDPVEGNYTYEFVAYQQPEAKATIGDKTDGKWPVLWSKGDQMGVYKADGTFVGVATVSDESEGQNSGNFRVSSDVELVAGENLYFSYPYVKDAEIKTGKVAAEQTLGTSGVGANAIAYATVAYNPGNTQFVLTHANAYLKFNIKSEDFAGYNLTGVTLWADGAELAGSVNIADGGELTVSAAEDYVKSSLAAPVTVSASDVQTVCVAALPVDLSEKTVYAIVHMKGVEDTETATHTVELPIRLNGAGSLNAGSVTEIDLPSLTTALAPKWYEPVETRYVAAYGDGWCYGPANTVVFTQSGETKTFDLKARGNFMKVKEPKYVQVVYSSNITDRRNTKGIIKINNEETSAGSGNQLFDLGVASDCTIDIYMKAVESNPRGHMAGIFVKDADKNVLWGINLWLTLSELTTVSYDNGQIMDRNLGASTSPVSDKSWASNGCYFQWGRPFAFPHSTSRGTPPAESAVTVKTDLEKSAAKPYTLFYYPNGELYDWYYGDGTNDKTNDLNDLWGNPSTANNPSGSGVKSIYDPCPAGYRVASTAILKEVEDGISATISNGSVTSTGTTEVNATGSYFYLAYKDSYWGFAGGIWSNYTGVSAKNNAKSIAAYWANNNSTTASYGRCMFYQIMETNGTTWKNSPTKSYSRSKAEAYPVRCMVDTENR